MIETLDFCGNCPQNAGRVVDVYSCTSNIFMHDVPGTGRNSYHSLQKCSDAGTSYLKSDCSATKQLGRMLERQCASKWPLSFSNNSSPLHSRARLFLFRHYHHHRHSVQLDSARLFVCFTLFFIHLVWVGVSATKWQEKVK